MAEHNSTPLFDEVEHWLPVPIQPFHEDYEVSDHGRVRRLRDCKPTNRGYVRAKAGRLCKQHPNQKGYLFVTMIVNQVYKTVTVHKLVALAFIGKRLDGMEVNHKDGNKSNNCLSNLEYVTPSENTQHAYDHGLIKAIRGEDCHNVIVSETDVVAIRRLYATGKYSQTVIGSMFGIKQPTVSAIIRRRLWKHVV